MTIRERTVADVARCVTALGEVHTASNYPTRWPADPAGWLQPDHLLTAWVAERDTAIVGHVGIQAGEAEPGLAAATGLSTDDLALVTRLFVAPAARGLGLARALLDTVLAEGDSIGRRVGLDVTEASGAAIALYESLGWEYCGRERASWRTQDGQHPMIRYYLAPR